jgi:hypothetical protein
MSRWCSFNEFDTPVFFLRRISQDLNPTLQRSTMRVYSINAWNMRRDTVSKRRGCWTKEWLTPENKLDSMRIVAPWPLEQYWTIAWTLRGIVVTASWKSFEGHVYWINDGVWRGVVSGKIGRSILVGKLNDGRLTEKTLKFPYFNQGLRGG